MTDEEEILDPGALAAPPRGLALVVDDDVLSRRLMGAALAERGFEVLAAEDGSAGLAVLLDQLLRLDLLVLDLCMPGLDGERLVRLIRGAGGERDLPVVVVSGRLDAAAEERLLWAGATAVLPKALGPAEAVRRALAAMRSHRRARRARALAER